MILDHAGPDTASRGLSRDDISRQVSSFAIRSEATGYRSSHRKLLTPLRPPAGSSSVMLGDSGGVILPIHRPMRADMTEAQVRRNLPGLALAADLALSHRCPLVICCSRVARSDGVPIYLARRLGRRLVAVDLDQVHERWIPDLRSGRNYLTKLHRDSDVGRKRNLGLLVSRWLGWGHVLFLDDDVSPVVGTWTLDTTGLSQALGVLGQESGLAAIGWTLESFDDNSVVGHARRLVGLDQQIFISSGALLVRSDDRIPFFPEIYNEDWLFLIALAAGSPDFSRALGWAGRVNQRPYDPFRPIRAASEEAGDVLAEGLMNLIEDHGPAFSQLQSLDFWESSLRVRRSLISDIDSRTFSIAETGPASAVQPAPHAVRASMAAALSVNRALTPIQFMEYVSDWQRDHSVWREYLASASRSVPSTIAHPYVALADHLCL